MSGLGIAVIAVRMFAKPAQRLREEGAWVGGRWVTGQPTTVAIRAVIQGVNDKDLSQVPNGERATEYRGIWTEAELRTADDENGLAADIVIDEFGIKWRLIQSGYRVESGFTYCIGEKVDDRGRNLNDD